ncbi:MAG: ferrous iron transport protein A [Alphaproteobacteria bacterium]|uniref:Ferrous iron transport protein A n=1 Tax=Candidatus Nitrobium versatile TaxID=2884831 RepID=A0A953SG05_9BACT|nr:ferrous iron transport protein A [Candidatus Nitrobium versatile]
MIPLGLLAAGEKGEVMGIRGGGNSAYGGLPDCSEGLCRIEDMGLRAGKVVEMLNNEGRGALLLKIDESRIAIGRTMAMKILVRKQ